MLDHEIKMAIGHLQRAMRELCGYAPPAGVDLIDYHPHKERSYVITEALDFYAHANPEDIAVDNGKIAREALGPS